MIAGPELVLRLHHGSGPQSPLGLVVKLHIYPNRVKHGIHAPCSLDTSL